MPVLILKEFSRYEIKVFILLSAIYLPMALSYIVTIFSHFTPEYHCNVEDEIEQFKKLYNVSLANSSSINLDHFIPYERDVKGNMRKNKCQKYKHYFSDIPYSGIDFIERKNETLKCNQFTFYLEKGSNSAIKEFSMVCDGNWKKTFATTAFLFGIMVGSIIGGYVSDRCGRRPCLLGSMTVQSLILFAFRFATTYTIYTILLFLLGCATISVFTVGIILGMEMTPTHHRNICSFILHAAFSLGYMLTPLAGYLLQNWKWLTMTYGLIGIPFISYYWILDESPHWLYSVGRNVEADAIIDKISKYNEENRPVKEQFLYEEKQHRDDVWSMWAKILKRPMLVFRTAALFFAWGLLAMIYYVIALNTNSLSGNRFLNCFYVGLTQLVSYTICFFALDHAGRRNSYIAITGIMAVAIWISIPLSSWNDTAATVITMLEMMCATMAFYVVYVYTGELYPTCVRQTALNNASAVGRIGSLLSPIIISDENNQLVVSIIIGSVSMLSAITFLFLPKTNKVTLPNTIEDVLNMKRPELLTCCKKSGTLKRLEVVRV